MSNTIMQALMRTIYYGGLFRHRRLFLVKKIYTIVPIFFAKNTYDVLRFFSVAANRLKVNINGLRGVCIGSKFLFTHNAQILYIRFISIRPLHFGGMDIDIKNMLFYFDQPTFDPWKFMNRKIIEER